MRRSNVPIKDMQFFARDPAARDRKHAQVASGCRALIHRSLAYHYSESCKYRKYRNLTVINATFQEMGSTGQN